MKSSGRRVPVVGLVGPIGAGKSSLAQALAHRRRVAVIDADRVGHGVLDQPDVRRRLRHRFGPSIFGREGRIDRSALARRVFGAANGGASLRALEEVVHPVMEERFRQEIEQLRQSGQFDAVLLDAAVLFEAGWDRLCDAVVFVDAAEPVRRKRVEQARNWSPQDLANREACQWPAERKRRLADFVIVNDGALEDAVTKLEAVVDTLAAQPERPVNPSER